MKLSKETITLISDEDTIPIRCSLDSASAHRSLLEQEPMIANGNPVDMCKWFAFPMFDINSNFGFGEDMGYYDWVKFVIDYFYAATLLHQCHKFWPLNRLLALLIPPSTRKMQISHNEASLKGIRNRMAVDTDRHDFMHHFQKQAIKEGLPIKMIETQGAVVILADSETSSVAETAAIYHILTHLDIYKKLREEI
ncbi:cytochrome P450 [Daldinia loculata]|uniref:cytochrome P450 n=1 Tax=Daldinia loculata TaxID=103429 RepID=UPI0020C32639|nr:cytochrome P450 [Daldinia loculata]KAI1645951.1 cytochrome P450 [Daldinia loculata]